MRLLVNNNHGNWIENFFIRKQKTENWNINSFKLTQEFTDHYSLIASLDDSVPDTTRNEKYTCISYKNLKNIANNENWDKINITDLNIAIQVMINGIQVRINLATTSKVKYEKKPKNPWITHGITKSYKTKELLHRIWKRNPNDENLKSDFKIYEKFYIKWLKMQKLNIRKIK